MYSKELFEKYPYAFSHYVWTGEVYYEDGTNEPYSLDEMIPKGWSKLFWMCMKELREPLEKAGLIDKFYFVQVKEKYGELCLYHNGATDEVLDIIRKYEYLSQFVCDACGKPAEVRTYGWVENICKDCFSQRKNHDQCKYAEIKLNLQPTGITFSADGKQLETRYDYTETWQRYLKEINE